MRADDAVIARIGASRIGFSEVACDRAAAAANPHWLKGRTAEAACAAEEQDAFRRLVSRALIDKVMKLNGWTVPEDMVNLYRAPFLLDDVLFEEAEARARAIPEAVLRVLKGAPIDAVYESDVKSSGVSRSAFQAEVAKFGTYERAARYLANHRASFRRGFEDLASRRAKAEFIRKQIDEAARRRNLTYDVVADEFVDQVKARIQIEILDSRFALPSGREIF